MCYYLTKTFIQTLNLIFRKIFGRVTALLALWTCRPLIPVYVPMYGNAATSRELPNVWVRFHSHTWFSSQQHFGKDALLHCGNRYNHTIYLLTAFCKRATHVNYVHFAWRNMFSSLKSWVLEESGLTLKTRHKVRFSFVFTCKVNKDESDWNI